MWSRDETVVLKLSQAEQRGLHVHHYSGSLPRHYPVLRAPETVHYELMEIFIWCLVSHIYIRCDQVEIDRKDSTPHEVQGWFWGKLPCDWTETVISWCNFSWKHHFYWKEEITEILNNNRAREGSKIHLMFCWFHILKFESEIELELEIWKAYTYYLSPMVPNY